MADDAEARFRLILDHLPYPTYVWRRRGDDFVLAEFNRAAYDLTRGGVTDALGQTLMQMFGDRPEVLEDFTACVTSKHVVHREDVFHLRSINERRHLSVTYAWAPPDMVIVHTDDRTEQRQLEQQLRQAQKMEAVGHLAGGIAHDFNNLLTVILGYAELLLTRADLPTQVIEDADEIVKAARSAASLTRQLLAFSRRSMLEPREISLNDVVAHVRTLIARLIGVEIELDISLADDLLTVRADPAHLEQVVMNLAVNARDAMPQGGRLSISTANATLDERFVADHPGSQAGPHAMIAVADTGLGMDEGVKARLFEPFFTTKELGKGSGLGLAMVYGAVKQSGGFISVDSQPGHGATFRIYLPVSAAE